jgi:outer membrane protein insertion porin family
VIRLETEFPLPLPEEYGISAGAFLDYGSVWDVGAPRSSRAASCTTISRRGPSPACRSSRTRRSGPLRFNFTRPIQIEEFDRENNFDVTVSTRF